MNLKGLVVFTAHKYDLPYTVYIDKYNADGEVGNILRKNHLTESREYEKYFDFVKWFNEADGGNYDVSKFIIQMQCSFALLAICRSLCSDLKVIYKRFLWILIK